MSLNVLMTPPGGGGFNGGALDDLIYTDRGPAGATVDGSLGNDVILGSNGSDVIFGYDDNDTLMGSMADVSDAFLTAVAASGTIPVEYLFADDNQRDEFYGENGDDWIVMGSGDYAAGGSGANTYDLRYAMGGAQQIIAFQSGQDTLLVNLNHSDRLRHDGASPVPGVEETFTFMQLGWMGNGTVYTAGVEYLRLANARGADGVSDLVHTLYSGDTMFSQDVVLTHNAAFRYVKPLVIDYADDGVFGDAFTVRADMATLTGPVFYVNHNGNSLMGLSNVDVAIDFGTVVVQRYSPTEFIVTLFKDSDQSIMDDAVRNVITNGGTLTLGQLITEQLSYTAEYSANTQVGGASFTGMVTTGVTAEHVLMQNIDLTTYAPGMTAGMTIRGSLEANTVIASAFGDTVVSGDGNDVIDGKGGNDNLRGGFGDDSLVGDLGDDTMLGASGADTMVGGIGRDRLVGGEGHDSLNGGARRDVMFGGEGDDTLDGGIAGDVMRGDAGNDSLSAGDGNDRVFGGDGNDQISGGMGDDSIFGDMGNDYIIGGDGADTITGGAGNDTVVAQGNDMITSDGGNDLFIFRTTDVATISLSQFNGISGDPEMDQITILDDFGVALSYSQIIGSVGFGIGNASRITIGGLTINIDGMNQITAYSSSDWYYDPGMIGS